MVKREKSPEINEDIILFVVWNPYPLNPNWVYEQDVQDCAKWVAEAIHNEYYLISIHHKPSSRGMILLEISKEFTDHGRILGEHQWCNFLKDPTKYEEGHKTCVYYSVYRTCRDARKDGWNPILIPTKCFKDWSPGTGRIVSPYPEPKHCAPPPEDRTSKQICRHIPTMTTKQATPSKPTGPVVGSSAWIAQQKQDVPNLDNESTPQVGNLQRQNKMKSPTTTNFAATSLPGETSVLPQSSMTALPKSKPKAVPLQKFISQSPAPQTRAQAPAWNTRSLSSSSAIPTGPKKPAMEEEEEEPPTKPQNAWSTPLKIAPLKAAKSTTANPDSTESWHSHDSWADLVEGELITNSQIPFQPSDDENDDFLSPMERHFTNSDSIPSNKPSEGSSSSKNWSKAWSDDEEEDLQKKSQEISCPTHGPACPRKICQDYNKLERDRKREEAKKSGQWRGRGRGRRGRGQDRNVEVN